MQPLLHGQSYVPARGCITIKVVGRQLMLPLNFSQANNCWVKPPKVPTYADLPQDILEAKVPNQELLNHQVQDMCQTKHVCKCSRPRVSQQICLLSHTTLPTSQPAPEEHKKSLHSVAPFSQAYQLQNRMAAF